MFLKEHTVDDVIFGAEFENKVNPPTGAWLAVKFANLIDPALITDMYSNRPWLYSPMLCAMNVVSVVKAKFPVEGAAKDIKASTPPMYASGPELSVPTAQVEENAKKLFGDWIWGADKELLEDNTLLVNPSSASAAPLFPKDGIAERRKYFYKKQNREAVTYSPDKIYNLEVSIAHTFKSFLFIKNFLN